MTINVSSLNLLLDTPNYIQHRRAMMEFLATHPAFRRKQYIGMPIEQQREHVMEQIRVLVSESGLINLRDQFEKPDRWAATAEPIAYVDNNLLTKLGVMFGLFGSSLFLLGSEYHVNRYWNDVETLKVRGCFCMTELNHGSNVRSLGTTAVYNVDSKQFILNTPDDSAQKYFIGGLAVHCTHAIVFAQLFADGQARGVHAFIVQLRDDSSQLLPNVHIADCGAKSGLNGVDNGRLWLSNVSVDRSALLNRLGTVDESGRYHSEIASNNARFGKMLALLALGRVGVAVSATSFSKIGLYIAIRYAFSRRQFSLREGQPEVPIIEYSTHQLRLFPLLARTYAINLALSDIKMEAFSRSGNAQAYLDYLKENSKDVHILTCGIKPIATWHRRRVLYTCRECCGGQGILASNLVGVLISETDADITWEGDNTVLLQQVASHVMKKFVADLRSQSKLSLAQQYIKSVTVGYLPNNGGNDFRERSFYLEAFQFRQRALSMHCLKILHSLKSISDPKDKFAVFNRALPTMLELALSSIENDILARFHKAFDACQDDNKDVLLSLFQLHAAHLLHENMAFFQAERYFSPAIARDLKSFILELCSKIKPNALDLVAAFNIDPRLVDAPIAHDYWQQINRRHFESN